MIGDHEPYGKVWRFGANEATTFVTGADVIVGGQAVPDGSYTLFVIPNPDKWVLIINKKTGEWGIPYKYESDELARVDMKLSTLPSLSREFHHLLRAQQGWLHPACGLGYDSRLGGDPRRRLKGLGR